MAPHLSQLAASQTRSLDAINKALAPSRTAARLFGDSTALKSLSALVRTSAIPTFQLPPSVTASLGAGALAIPRTSLLSAQLRLPYSSYSQLARTLEGVAKNDRVEIPPSLLASLAAKQTLQMSEVITAARASATQLEHEGEVAEAKVLSTAASEVEHLAEAPSFEEIEGLTGTICEQLEKGFNELHERLDKQEDRHQHDRDADRQHQIVLFYYGIFASFLIALYFYLLGVRLGP